MIHDQLTYRLWTAVSSATGAPFNFTPTQWRLPWRNDWTTVAIVTVPAVDLDTLWRNLAGFVGQLVYRWTSVEGRPTLVIDGIAGRPVKLIVRGQ